MGEDIDFALRLKKWGKKYDKKYGTITKAQMIASCRIFDMFGTWEGLSGMDSRFSLEVFFQPERTRILLKKTTCGKL